MNIIEMAWISTIFSKVFETKKGAKKHKITHSLVSVEYINIAVFFFFECAHSLGLSVTKMDALRLRSRQISRLPAMMSCRVIWSSQHRKINFIIDIFQFEQTGFSAVVLTCTSYISSIRFSLSSSFPLYLDATQQQQKVVHVCLVQISYSSKMESKYYDKYCNVMMMRCRVFFFFLLSFVFLHGNRNGNGIRYVILAVREKYN